MVANLGFIELQIWDLLDIGLVSVLFYYIMILLRGTRATQMAIGIIGLAFIYLFATWVHLNAIVWLVSLVWQVGVIVLVIVFQPELRGALTKIGTYGIAGIFSRRRHSVLTVEEITKAAVEISRRGYGGLIVLEQEIGLRNYIETGRPIQCRANAEILVSIFFTNAPLHDGAVIIRGEDIVAGGCALPLTQNPAYDHLIGMRHRAAVGLASETDSVTVVVSEETGNISIAHNSQLHSNIPADKLQGALEEIIGRTPSLTGEPPVKAAGT